MELQRRYFLIFTPGEKGYLILDGQTLVDTFSRPGVISFAKWSMTGDVRMFGDQVVARVERSSVVTRRDGRHELRKTGSSLAGPPIERAEPGL